MKVFFFNRNTGSGVEFAGNIFISILERTIGINSIDIYNSQCTQSFLKIDFSSYDLIILNDVTSKCHYFDTLKTLKKPIINLCFDSVNSYHPCLSLILDFNFLFHYNKKSSRKIKQMELISGNIWKDYVPWNERCDDILYISRFNKYKLIPSFIRLIRDQNKTIRFYGPIHDKEYYESNKDVVDYKGYICHRDLLKVYNQYKYLWLFSEAECLSMTLREALVCGTYPIVLDEKGYTALLSGNIYTIKDRHKINSIEQILNSLNLKAFNHPLNKKYIKESLSFNRMVMIFLSEIEKLMNIELSFNKDHRASLQKIGPPSDRQSAYKSDSIDWENVII